jgi:hypothetical protein
MTRLLHSAARWAAGWLPIPLLAIASASCPASVQAQEPAPAGGPTRGRDTGYFLSTGWVRDRLDLNYDRRVTQPEANIVSGTWGNGVSFGIGYSFGPKFRTELSVSAAEHEARPEGTKGGFVTARFAGYVPLWTRGWLRPHLIGGFDACVTALDPKAIPDRAYMMVGGDFGAGARLVLSRHWSIQGDYLHSILDIGKETLGQPGRDDLRDVGGSGWSDMLRVDLLYDF